MGIILDSLMNPVIGIPVAILTAIVIAVYIAKQLGIGFGDEGFENEELETLIKPQFTQVIDKFGVRTKATFKRDLRTVAEVYKTVRYTEANDYDDNIDQGEKQSVSSIDVDIEETAEPNDLLEAGVISQKEKKEIEEHQKVPHRLIQTRPASAFVKPFWLFTDWIFGFEFFTDYYLVPEMVLKDSPADNTISVHRNVEFRPMAGIFIPLYESSLGILKSVTMRSLYRQALEDQANYHEKVNYFDAQFSQKVQEIDAEAEADQKRYNQGVASDANAD